MKSKYQVAVVLTGLVLAVSCSSDSQVPIQSTEITVPVYQLSIVDSIGVELGDSVSMIGSIDGFCYHPDGSILVLDSVFGLVRVISESGEIRFFGRHGEGPGEFIFPRGICAMQDGRILVAEPAKREVMEFDIAGDYVGSYLKSEHHIPTEIYQIDYSSIVGSMYQVELSEGRLSSLFYYVGRFDSSSEPSVKYLELFTDLSSAEMYTEMELLDYCADPAGRAYVVPDHTEYRITVFFSDGSIEHEISPDVTRMEKSGEQIRSEIEEFEDSHMGDRAYHGGYQPSPYYQLISLTGVDMNGCLWVERYDTENGFLFDIWDSTGSLAYTACLEEFVTDLDITFRVDNGGILGANVDSDQYPRIYTFELDN